MEENLIVLETLEDFLHDVQKNDWKSENAKNKLMTLINEVIQTEVFKLGYDSVDDLRSNQRPKSKKNLTFQYKQLEDWHYQEVKTWFINQQGSDEWINFLVQNIDYIVNPHVIKKNEKIVNNFLLLQIPALKQANKVIFEEFQYRIDELIKECYSLTE